MKTKANQTLVHRFAGCYKWQGWTFDTDPEAVKRLRSIIAAAGYSGMRVHDHRRPARRSLPSSTRF